MSHQLTAIQQYWTEILASAENSGLPTVEFANANQLKPQELYRWCNQLKNMQNPWQSRALCLHKLLSYRC